MYWIYQFFSKDFSKKSYANYLEIIVFCLFIQKLDSNF